jgi:Asp-tRNA(Asn)/Glu-tRNA(Gln) amidotransferase A subunit family amidase
MTFTSSIKENNLALQNGETSVETLLKQFRDVVLRSKNDCWEEVIERVPSPVILKGALSGLIIGVKDNIATRDFPTQMGSRTWRGTPGGFDSRVVSALRMNGAIIGGKTKCSEFAVHEITNTKNPRYVDCVPGTSSSGSAAAIAASEVCISLGTQSLGSIAKPASYCGVLGFKPTFGDIPRTGILKTTELFDSVGFFGRRVEDLKEVYRVTRIQGPDHPIHERQRKKVAGAFSRAIVLTGDGVDQANEYLLERLWRQVYITAEDLKLASVTTLQFDFELLRWAILTIYHRDLSYFLRDHSEPDNISSTLLEIFREGQNTSSGDFLKATEIVESWRKYCDAQISSEDLIFSLATSQSAPKHGEGDLQDANLFITSAGLPQIVLPLLRQIDGRLVGLSLSAKRFSDDKILNLAHKILPFDVLEIPSLPS